MPHCAITQTKPLHSSRRPGRAEVAIKQSTKYQSCNKQTKWTKKSSIYHLLSWAHSISVKTPWAANWPDFCCHKRKGWCWLTLWWNQVNNHLNWFNHKLNGSTTNLMILNHNEENLDWRLQSLAQGGSDDANEASSCKSFLQLTAVILQCVIQHIEIWRWRSWKEEST